MQSPPGTPQFQVPNLGNLAKARQQAEAGIAQAVHQLSLQIYARIAGDYMTLPLDDNGIEVLREKATAATQAAKCYFEVLGVIAPPNKQEE